MIGDGRTVTHLSLHQWTATPPIVQLAARRKIKIPPLTRISDEPPVPAFVNYGSWKVCCPDPLCGGAEDVWREGPHLMICMSCGNRMAGGLWLRVLLPEPVERDAIEERLSGLPRHEQNWQPEEVAVDA